MLCLSSNFKRLGLLVDATLALTGLFLVALLYYVDMSADESRDNALLVYLTALPVVLLLLRATLSRRVAWLLAIYWCVLAVVLHYPGSTKLQGELAAFFVNICHIHRTERALRIISYVMGGLAGYEVLLGVCSLLGCEQRRDDPSSTHASLRSTTSRPWWWSGERRNDPDDLGQALLGFDDGPQWTAAHRTRVVQQTGVSPWARIWRRSEDDNDNVDLESQQQEWLNRSQEDPFWWSRDDDEDAGSQTPNANDKHEVLSSQSIGRRLDLSWAEDAANDGE